MFYKLIDEHLHYGPYVQFPDGLPLSLDLKDTYEYPVNGWYFFETEEQAKEFFGITE